MTLIITSIQEDSYYIASDTEFYDIEKQRTFPSKTRKIFEVENVLIGIAGSTCLINDIDDIDKKTLHKVLTKIVSCDNENFSALVNDGKNITYYCIDNHVVLDGNYWAIGSGAKYALGALHALKNYESLDNYTRASEILSACKPYCNTVGGYLDMINKNKEFLK